MLRDEVRKTNEAEAAKSQERLVNPSNNDDKKNSNDANDGKSDTEKLVEKALDEKVKAEGLPEEDGSDTSEKIEEEIKENKPDNPGDHHDDLQGSTVEIVQPADLKPKHLGFTRTLLLAMFAAMIGTGAQFGYAVGVMNAPSEVIIHFNFFVLCTSVMVDNQKLYQGNLFETLQFND